MTERLPGKGVLGWLGRQFGYVKSAVKAQVGPKVLYRRHQVDQVKLSDQPDVTLRRTVTDEVIVQKPSSQTNDSGRQ